MIDVKRRTMDYEDYLVLSRAARQEAPTEWTSFATARSTAREACCPSCGMSEDEQPGWLRSDLPVRHAYFGFLVRCPTCTTGERLQEELRRKARLDGWLATATFETLRVPRELLEVIQACKLLARQPMRWITLWGMFGSGKTHLLAATVNAALEQRRPAVYMTTADLVAAARSAVGEGGDAFEMLVRELSDVQLLALDELDVNKAYLTDFARDLLFRVLDARSRCERGTLFALQDAPEQLINTPLGYLASRILSARNQVFHLKMPDMRSVNSAKY